jgi:hypothetical protein
MRGGKTLKYYFLNKLKIERWRWRRKKRLRVKLFFLLLSFLEKCKAWKIEISKSFFFICLIHTQHYKEQPSYHFQFLEETLQNARSFVLSIVIRVIRLISTTIITISTAVKSVSAIEVVIIIVRRRKLIRIWVASSFVVGPRIAIIISTCLRIVMLINSRVEVVAVRVQMIVISSLPFISVFIELPSTAVRVAIIFKVFIFIVALDIRVRFRDFSHAFLHN